MAEGYASCDAQPESDTSAGRADRDADTESGAVVRFKLKRLVAQHSSASRPEKAAVAAATAGDSSRATDDRGLGTTAGRGEDGRLDTTRGDVGTVVRPVAVSGRDRLAGGVGVSSVQVSMFAPSSAGQEGACGKGGESERVSPVRLERRRSFDGIQGGHRGHQKQSQQQIRGIPLSRSSQHLAKQPQPQVSQVQSQVCVCVCVCVCACVNMCVCIFGHDYNC